MILRIAPADLARIRALCRAAAPAEACGLLVGRGRRVLSVRRIVPAANLLAATPGRFELDPRLRLAVEKQCRGTRDRIIGHWHSHPGGRAEPSATDLAMAWEPELVWLVVAVAADGAAAAAFRPTPDATDFTPVPLARRQAGTRQKNPCNAPPIPT